MAACVFSINLLTRVNAFPHEQADKRRDGFTPRHDRAYAGYRGGEHLAVQSLLRETKVLQPVVELGAKLSDGESLGGFTDILYVHIYRQLRP